jgi:hypothetical protein
MRSSLFLKVVLPRSVTGLYSDKNQFSNHFIKEDAGIFYCLSNTNLFFNKDQKKNSFSAAIRIIFEISSTLPYSSENESRANNSTRAELFAGFLKYFIESDFADDTETHNIFLNFLIEPIEEWSIDYCRDWSEGILFAYTSRPTY